MHEKPSSPHYGTCNFPRDRGRNEEDIAMELCYNLDIQILQKLYMHAINKTIPKHTWLHATLRKGMFKLVTSDHHFLNCLFGWGMSDDPTPLHTRSPKGRVILLNNTWENDMKSYMSRNKLCVMVTSGGWALGGVTHMLE